MQESPTLDLANDCSRFVAQHFEIISASSPHIYHSALVLTPRESIVWKIYQLYAQPFMRVVRGVPTLWDSNTAAATSRFDIGATAWSQCNRFIAIGSQRATRVDILDSTTLQRLQSLKLPRIISIHPPNLAFSPDSRMLTSLIFEHSPGLESALVVTWDLQTGGIVSVIPTEGEGNEILGGNITYSMDGKMVSACLQYEISTTISFYEVISGVYMHDVDHIALVAQDVYKIWTHGESLRFATLGPTTITIWEVGFITGATPAEVEAISIPVNIIGVSVFTPMRQSDIGGSEFHPASYRLAFVGTGDTLLIWDARASKFVLHHPGIPYCWMTFSSDGRFFACTADGPGLNLWKESPTGYTFLAQLTTGAILRDPRLSPNGQSIITLSHQAIQLWRTNHSTTTVPAQTLQNIDEQLILEFLPGRPSVVTTRKGGTMVEVLDLKSGIVQLTVDTSVEVYGLRPIEDTIVVIGHDTTGCDKAIFWDLPGGDFLPGARMSVEDSTRIIWFDSTDSNDVGFASISSDFRYIALGGYGEIEGSMWNILEVHCTSTRRIIRKKVVAFALSFASGGHDILCCSSNTVNVFTVTPDALNHTKSVFDIGDGSLGFRSPWGSSRGYKVTDDGWVLGVGGERLLMLLPLWQSPILKDRVWNGDFLALLHDGLLEPVILELRL